MTSIIIAYIAKMKCFHLSQYFPVNIMQLLQFATINKLYGWLNWLSEQEMEVSVSKCLIFASNLRCQSKVKKKKICT